MCRDPDGTGRPWCYTTNKDIRWEYCAVPICTCCMFSSILFFLLSVRNAKTKTDNNGNDVYLKTELLYKYIFDEIIISLFI